MSLLRIVSLFVALLLFGFVQHVGAQNQVFVEIGVADVSAETPIPSIKVGDPLPVELRIIHPKGVRLIPLDLGGEWGDIEVLNVPPPTIRQRDDSSEETIQLINVTAWEPGTYQTPALPFKLSDGLGNLYDVSAETIEFNVETILAPADTALRDIKPQATLPFLTSPYARYVLIAMAVVGLGLIAFIIQTTLKMRGTPSEPEPILDTRPAHVIALSELSNIEQKDLIAQGEFKQYYTEISDTVRRYLERAFRIPAMDSTTFEIRQALKERDLINATNQRHLIGLLNEADLVKFADFAPRPDDAAQFPREARQFVTMTAERAVVDTDDEVSEDGDSAETPQSSAEGAA